MHTASRNNPSGDTFASFVRPGLKSIETGPLWPVRYLAKAFPAKNPNERGFVSLCMNAYDIDGEKIISTVVDTMTPVQARMIAFALLEASAASMPGVS